jgi:CRISPR/Cas system type I-B associated protein Csh2 (Cas7 group RAMP superfamily)
LLELTEADAAGDAGNGNSARNIAEARGRLLQAARKAADKTRKRLADIITEASDGKLSLDSLKNLTDADVPLVEAASSRIG